MKNVLRFLLAALLLAGCTPEDVVPQRQPRFQALAEAPRVALVLGSGGPRGFAHIGVLKALEDAGVKPDLIVGSSVGAMVGALYASGINARELERMAYDINVMEFFEFSLLSGGLATGGALQSYINTRVKDRPMEALGIPFIATATRVRDKELVIFNRGDTGLAVRASSASPGQFEPVRIGAESYVDGDEVSPVPIRVARRLGAKLVIAVNVGAFLESTPAHAPAEWRVGDERRTKAFAAEAGEADIVIHPDIGYYAGHTEEYRRKVIAMAERATRAQIPAIRARFAQAGMPLAAPQAGSVRIPVGEASR